MTIAAKDRVFSKWMVVEISVPATDSNEGMDTFVTEEDIEIIGWSLAPAFAGAAIGNDGVMNVTAELSQSGQFGKDGMLTHANSRAIWNTAPATVDYEINRVDVMLPEGKRVPVAEGGTIYLHVTGTNTSAAAVGCDAWALVFFTKGNRG